MKRFLLFCSADFYPSGGWSDFIGSYDSVAEARSALDEPLTDNEGDPFSYRSDAHWAHVVDTETSVIVWSTRQDETAGTLLKLKP